MGVLLSVIVSLLNFTAPISLLAETRAQCTECQKWQRGNNAEASRQDSAYERQREADRQRALDDANAAMERNRAAQESINREFEKAKQQLQDIYGR